MRLSIRPKPVLRHVVLALVALLAKDAWATPVPVNWVPANGTTVSASTISRSAGLGWSDTAVGTLALTSGPGYLEFETAENDRTKAAGLGYRDNNGGLEAIDFGFLLRADGTAAVAEKGAAVQGVVSYSPGDRFRVAIEGSSVVFRINGSLVRTSALPVSYPLVAEATLLEAGATILNAEVDGTTAETVLWASAAKTTTLPGFLSKTTAVAAWDAGAISTMGLGPDDGYLEVSASVGSTLAMVGLSNGNTNSGFSDIDHALYMASGTLYIYEGGLNRGSFGALLASDRLRVSIEGGVVKYRKNGTLVYTSALSPTFPLLVDSSLHSSGARVSGAVLSGTLVQVAVSQPTFSVDSGLYPTSQSVTVVGEAGSTIHYTTNGAEPTQTDPSLPSGSTLLMDVATTLKAKAWKAGVYPSSTTEAWYVFGTPASENVEWTAHVNAASTGATLSKTTAVVAWDAGAISTSGLASPDGYLEVSASLSPNIAMVGLSSGNANSGYSDIDFALYFASGALYVYEGGINRGGFGPLVATDKVRVSVESGVVRYRKNGVLLYTSALAPSFPLLVDSSLHSSGAMLQGAVLSGALATTAVQNPAFSVPSGIYDTPFEVVVTGAPGSTIHYTTNGLTPTEEDPIVESGSSLLIEVTTTLRARAFASGLIPSGTTAAIYQFGTVSTEDVVWTAQVNTASGGNALSKTTGVVAWDAGAISTRGIISPGGYLEVSASLSPNIAMVGLSHGSANSGFSDIDYALYFASGTLYIYEGGLNRGSFGTMVATDKLRVSVESGVVKYRKNGNLVYTSALAPTYPLLVDASLHSSGASLLGAVISGNLVQVAASRPAFSVGSGLYATPQEVVVTAGAGSTIHFTTNGVEPTEADAVIASGASVFIEADTTLKAKAWATGLYASGTTSATYKFGTASTENVAWTLHVNSTATANTLSKSVTTTAWDASAVSSKAIDSPDGYLEVSASVSPKIAMAGLAYGNTNSGFSDIDYALYMASGTLYIYEGGLNRGAFGSLAVADKLRVSVEAGVVRYRKNGNLIYTSSLAPRYPLLVDTSLHSSTAAVQGAVISGLLVNTRTSAPAASPEAGGYALPMEVALTADSGASIRYTTDGSEATVASPLYATPITVSAATTIKARAFGPGFLDSDVSTHAYFLHAPGSPPSFSPLSGTYLGPLVVTASTSTPGGRIHYTLNGSDPTEADPSVASGGGINVYTSGTLRGITLSPTNAPSGVTVAVYELVATPPVQTAAPGPSPSTLSITLAAGSGAQVRYTTDGSEPSLSSTLYAEMFTLTTSATVKARSYVAGWTPSATSSGTYVIEAVQPVLSPASGRWFTQRTVTATTTTAGATLRYTTDGTEPTQSSPEVGPTGELLVNKPTSLKVKAFKAGITPSDSARGTYLVTGQVAAGDVHSIALKTDGTVWAWGGNDSGQVGDGTITPRYSPVQILSNVVAVAAGRLSSYALQGDGTVRAWGENGSGQLGDGTTTDSLSPIMVPGLASVAALGAGHDHVLVALSDGSVKSWGSNSSEKLGRVAGPSGFNTPGVVAGLVGVKQVAAAELHSMALREDGSVAAWGYGGEGQIGDGTTTSRPRPVTLPGILATAIAAGGRSSYAIQQVERKLSAWGLNAVSQLADGTITNRLSPVVVAPEAREVAAGETFMMFGSASARLFGGGSNAFGQLGDGGLRVRVVPVRSSLSKAVVSVGAGSRHALTSVASGEVWSTGLNHVGQRGLGHAAVQVFPAPIPSFAVFDGAALSTDTDGDGLDLYREILNGTDPQLADTNGNGLPDGVEAQVGLESSEGDTDHDGLSNDAEVLGGTDPFNADTDGDGTVDGADTFPLDPTKSQLAAQPGDTTPPVINLIRPTAANPIP